MFKKKENWYSGFSGGVVDKVMGTRSNCMYLSLGICCLLYNNPFATILTFLTCTVGAEDVSMTMDPNRLQPMPCCTLGACFCKQRQMTNQCRRIHMHWNEGPHPLFKEMI